MLIDAHTHVWIPEMREPSLIRAFNWKEARSSLPYKKYSDLTPVIPELYNDPGAEKWAKHMEYVGIDAAVNMSNDFGGAEGWACECAQLSVMEIHQEYARWTERHKGKFFSFMGVNPLRHNAVELLERGVKELGMKGLKLLPHTGFYPNDRVCYRLYEKCADLGIPVCIHTGAGIFKYPKYTNPMHLAEPALDFPELEFIMAEVIITKKQTRIRCGNEKFLEAVYSSKTFKEISENTGVGINTLISRKRYAVLALRERLIELYKLLKNN